MAATWCTNLNINCDRGLPKQGSGPGAHGFLGDGGQGGELPLLPPVIRRVEPSVFGGTAPAIQFPAAANLPLGWNHLRGLRSLALSMVRKDVIT